MTSLQCRWFAHNCNSLARINKIKMKLDLSLVALLVRDFLLLAHLFLPFFCFSAGKKKMKIPLHWLNSADVRWFCHARAGTSRVPLHIAGCSKRYLCLH